MIYTKAGGHENKFQEFKKQAEEFLKKEQERRQAYTKFIDWLEYRVFSVLAFLILSGGGLMVLGVWKLIELIW